MSLHYLLRRELVVNVGQVGLHLLDLLVLDVQSELLLCLGQVDLQDI